MDAENHVYARFIRNYHQRPFARVIFNVDGLSEGRDVTDGVLKTVMGEVTVHEAESNSPQPIVEVTLRGHLGFPNSLLEFDEIRKQVQEKTGALHVRLKNNTVPVEYGVVIDDNASRETRERRAIEDLVARDNRYQKNAQEMAELIIGAKQMALNDDAPDKILDYISTKTV